MIVQTLSKNVKLIAFFHFITLYASVVMPVVARASERKLPLYKSNSVKTPSINNNPTLFNGIQKEYSNTLNPKPSFQITKKDTKTRFLPGPTQPEMQSFQSVNSNNMVDLFTGDFSYNIPLIDVGGYPINLHYSSGITMDQESSWVGLGWNINPGAITRNMRGLPDDFNGSELVTKTLSLKPNKTFGVRVALSAEFYGLPLRIGASAGIFNNNYKGWGIENGINAGISSAIGSKGSLTAGLSINNNSQKGLDVGPTFSYQVNSNDDKTKGIVSIGTNYNSRIGIQSLQMTGQISQQTNAIKSQRNSFGTGVTSTISFSTSSYTPKITIPFSSTQFTFSAKTGGALGGAFPNTSITGYGSIQQIKDEDKTISLPAYGYLNYQRATGNENALLDLNREKEVTYRENVPHIAVPSYTYDTYSISGEGTGGMFRPYRGDVGFVYDHAMSSKSADGGFSLEIGSGAIFHGGVDISATYAVTKNNPWLTQNLLKDVIGFKQTDSAYESVYFKNPGEKTAVDQRFYDLIGDDKLMRVDLSPIGARNEPSIAASKTFSIFKNSRPVSKVTFGNNVYRNKRDKRTQVISYLNGSEAASLALDTIIRSYYINNFPSSNCNTNFKIIPRVSIDRKANHISEMTVLNSDGKRYIYGTPVYNYNQQDVSYAVNKGDENPFTGQTKYNTGDDNQNNSNGKDGYYNKEVLPAFSHSFLLTGILTSDYVDITGDGITDDDNGDAIRFNYTRVYNRDSAFAWRAPYDSAAYNEGLKTDKRDEKASYSYGEREVWYLNSVDSKAMIATFVLETGTTRLDGFAPNKAGGIDASKKLYRLKEINLYTKADYLKNGLANAKPIKTVHFEYSYELCKKNPSSLSNNGKLTLKRIWFTYNKNNKGQLNPYVFSYHSSNPDYLKGASDRWGNYKDSRNNPGQLTNMDYPYALQDSSLAALNASAWTLNTIKLPSGAQIKLTYESDDYAYIQNKRAMQLFSIAGFGAASTDNPSSNLYKLNSKKSDFNYVFINVSDQVSTKEDIKRKYLQGVTKLYFKLYVKMPDDKKWGSGSEYVPFYAEIDGENYGLKGSSADKKIWIKLKGMDEGSPAAVAALQFLRLNLPSKAYPNSEPGDNIGIRDAINIVLTAPANIKQSILGFPAYAMGKNWCNSITPSNSFVRLNNPYYKKIGGGLRVKKVEILDNFNKMTKQQQQESTYGQTYDYSTSLDINGITTRISSGVATYEPSIGNEENPFRLPIEFNEKVGILAPTNYFYTEYPLAESYYPAPIVGYSKVSVQSIHKDKKSATGIEETTFYTSYDFPVITEFTPLDDESKKTYNPKIRNFFRFAARHDVTFSQGFKVELNDMNGKLKSKASYAQNDMKNPISYTYNYYNVENESSLQKKLSSNVAIADSSNGNINLNGQIGKDIEIMVDVREQTSTTISGSIGINVDVLPTFPFPLPIPSIVPLPSSETDKFRSIAVMKVVQRYGILDSIVHIEKGSKVSTKNMVYDGETGEVLLSRTNNEFDDPVYNFNYPAHWAHSGMGLAYKNIGATWKNMFFKQGKLYNSDRTEMDASKFFESGDELLVSSPSIRFPYTSDICSQLYYIFLGLPTQKKIWALDASKGQEKHKGIYFIDKDGNPFSANSAYIKIIRSGKRNMPAIPVGTITSLQNPLKVINSIPRLVFDSSAGVVAASAAQFKDFWKVDSSSYRKDTVLLGKKLMNTISTGPLRPVESFDISYIRRTRFLQSVVKNYYESYSPVDFEASSYERQSNNFDYQRKSWLRFNLSSIPKGAVVTNATLFLPTNADRPHLNKRGTNKSVVQRVKGLWKVDQLKSLSDIRAKTPLLEMMFQETNQTVDPSTKVILNQTPANVPTYRDENVEVTSMISSMLTDYWASNNAFATALMIKLEQPVGNVSANDTLWSRLSYISGIDKFGKPCEGVNTYTSSGSGGAQHAKLFPRAPITKICITPEIQVTYYMPCSNDSSVAYSNTPTPGYYCYSQPVDSFICKPNINDTSVNPYRWGIFGNWRMNRAYSYFDKRKELDPLVETNIRKDGEIKSFVAFWAFANDSLRASSDTNRWVWNSDMNLFNRKGFEVENHDPLNRYNSGQYGYNQTMPVAVAQNARYREKAFDGFEDYDYRTDTCYNCETPRFIDLVKGGGTRAEGISHTGKYSLKINGNQSAATQIKIASLAEDATAPKLSIVVDSTTTGTTVVNGAGTGLQAVYKYGSGVYIGDYLQRTDPNLNFNWFRGGPDGFYHDDHFSVKWTGQIQPRYTDDYIFTVQADDFISIHINGIRIISTPDGISNPIRLQAGQLYSLVIDYAENRGHAYMILEWKSASGRQQPEVIPQSQFYLPSVTQQDVAPTIQSTGSYCIRLKNPVPTKVTLDRFSPLQGTQVVVSAWVKEEQPCITGSYANSQMQVSFNSGSPSTFTLKPEGNIIEGWQRIEQTITIPQSAATMNLQFTATSGTAVYFDDVRIHPFNSNLKSFVYNPVNLRLMAELDENNYATFYEYDDDGTLTRVKKETEKGIKTIEETRSALVKE